MVQVVVQMREVAMATTKRFDVGDRVRTSREFGDLAQGMLGTIRIVFFDAELYSVQFDRLAAPRIVHHVELELERLDERSANAD
jgi:hypothetical protein